MGENMKIIHPKMSHHAPKEYFQTTVSIFVALKANGNSMVKQPYWRELEARIITKLYGQDYSVCQENSHVLRRKGIHSGFESIRYCSVSQPFYDPRIPLSLIM